LPSGEVLIVHLNRDFGDTTSVGEPQDNEPAWPNMEVVVGLTHSGGLGQRGGGYWCAYIRRSRVWWCVDTQTNVINEKNPFDRQQDVNIIFLKK
jgi:hypothetical protein